MHPTFIVPVATLTGALGLLAAGEPAQAVIPYAELRLFIEYNSTDKDTGMQLFLDGESWRLLKITDPNGKVILDVKGKSSLKALGLTEFFFESTEPALKKLPLKEFFDLFPEGEYLFEGATIDGDTLMSTATFSHTIPDGPAILTPEEGSVVDEDDVVVAWEPVADPEGSRITAYQVIVTQELNVLPRRTFSVHVSAEVTAVTVPAEFLQDDADYEFEVLAIEEGGNQTITSSFFTTKR